MHLYLATQRYKSDLQKAVVCAGRGSVPAWPRSMGWDFLWRSVNSAHNMHGDRGLEWRSFVSQCELPGRSLPINGPRLPQRLLATGPFLDGPLLAHLPEGLGTDPLVPFSRQSRPFPVQREACILSCDCDIMFIWQSSSDRSVSSRDVPNHVGTRGH